jgi:DNA polymerase III delta prime subunit
MVVSDEKKIILKKIIKEIPTTLIAGKPGTGKGTFMDILLKETGCPYLKLNGSIDNSIDDIREKVRKFSTAFDPTSKKIVYFNECDRLSPAAMDSLKDLQESVQHITRFFFLSNDETLRNDIEGAIKSRCGYQINLNDPPGKNIYLRCLEILKKENVKIEDSKELLNLIKKCYPDMRKIIGTLQSNVQDGVLKKITFSTDQDLYAKIFKLMKTSDVDEVRKTIKSSFINYDDLYKYIYEEVVDNPDSIKNPADFMVIIGKYLYQNSVVAIKEINFMAFFVELINNEIL